MRSRPRVLHVLVTVVLAAWSAPTGAQALSLRGLSLGEVVSRAATIFVGRCVDARRVEGPLPGTQAIEATYAVSQWVKGAPGTADLPSQVTVRQVVMGSGDLGGPAFHLLPGQESVLFLHAPSALGFTSPVGMGQGVYRVVRSSPGGPDMVVRGAGRARGAAQRYGTISLEALLATVRSLAAKGGAVP